MEAVLDVLQQTDEALAAEAAREGSDGPAFVALVDRFRQRVWRICYRLLGNEQDANDAAQEVFVRLFTNRAKFAGRKVRISRILRPHLTDNRAGEHRL